jgi:replicative DNA helicase
MALGDIRRTVSAEDFYSPANQIIFNAACHLDDERKPIESRAILSYLTTTGEIKRLPHGATYISDLFGNAPAAGSANYYARIVHESATKRALATLGLKMQQMASMEGEISPSQMAEQMRSTLDSLVVERLGSDLPMIGDVLPKALQEVQDLSENGAVIGVPTGFIDLDRQLNGLQSGQMITIAARPGVGKALSLDTLIPTPGGWTTMREIKVGDQVLGKLGHPINVIGATEILYGRDCYQVEFTDSSSLIADGEHQWMVWSRQYGWEICTTVDLTDALARGCQFVIPATHISGQRGITWITRVPSIPVKCIEVDAEDHLYLAGKTMIPTHNSSLAMDIARHAAFRQDQSVIVFSLEMSSSELAMRMLSAESHVDLQALRTGAVTEDMWHKLADATTRMSGAKLAIDDTATVTLSEIRAKARAIQRRQGLNLIVIDYLQLMNADKRSDSRQQEVSDMSRGVKLLAKEFGIPVIVLSQLNRGPEQRQDKRPVISDLRESGSIEQDSDVVILLHREEMYEKETPRAGEADVIVAKQRSGPTGTVILAWQGKWVKFDNIFIA